MHMLMLRHLGSVSRVWQLSAPQSLGPSETTASCFASAHQIYPAALHCMAIWMLNEAVVLSQKQDDSFSPSWWSVAVVISGRCKWLHCHLHIRMHGQFQPCDKWVNVLPGRHASSRAP